jgi:hypothetical protein
MAHKKTPLVPQLIRLRKDQIDNIREITDRERTDLAKFVRQAIDAALSKRK